MKKIITIAVVLFSGVIGFTQTDSTLVKDTTQVKELGIDTTVREKSVETVPVAPAPAQKSVEQPKQKKEGGFSLSKVTFGLNVGLTVGDYASVYVAPRIGYYFTPSTVLGTQFIYRYNSQKVHNSGERFTSQSYGTGLWARQFILRKFFLHAEWEALNMPFYTSKNSVTTDEREWVNSIMLGGGYYKSLGRKGGISFSALYIVNYDDERSSYSSPWVIRVGAYF
tara:strand:- start:875 stop:1546 length:672 start_codon:yes stop_codon:yes gene_type:complete